MVRPLRVTGLLRTARVGWGRTAAEEIVGTHAEGCRQAWDVVQGETTFARLEPAEHGDVDVSALTDLLQCEALLGA